MRMTMSQSSTYQIRLSEEEKKETFEIFESLGIKPAQAIKLFFAQVRTTHSIPFPIEYKPNAKTIKAIEDSKQDKNVVQCEDTADLFAKLGI